MNKFNRIIAILIFSIALFSLMACKSARKYYLQFPQEINMFQGNDKSITANDKIRYNTTIWGQVNVPDGKVIDKLTIDGKEHSYQSNNRFLLTVKSRHKIEVSFKEKTTSTYSIKVKDDSDNSKLNKLIRNDIKTIYLSTGKIVNNTKPFDNKTVIKNDEVYLFLINTEISKKLVKFTVDGVSKRNEIINAGFLEEYEILKNENPGVPEKTVRVQVYKLIITGNHEIEYLYSEKKYANITVDSNVIIPEFYFKTNKVVKTAPNKYDFEIGATYVLEFKKIEGKMISKFEINGQNRIDGINKDLNTYRLEIREELTNKEIKLTYVDYEELAEVTLGSNLKFRDEKINPKRVKVGQYYEFIITPPKGKTISKVELNKQDLVSLVKDNIFACKITQNCKFELSFAEYKDTQKFKLTVDSRVELLEGLKAGEHPIGTKITFKVKHEENKYLEKVKFGSFEAEIKDKDFVYTCFLNGDLSITTSLQSHPTVTIDSANKDNLELLDGVEDTKQVKPNTTIRFKLKNLTEGYSYQVYIKDKQVKPEADGSYKYEVEKKSIIISVKKAKIAHQLTFNYNSFLFEDTKISYDNKVEHGEMVKFKFPKETNLENVKHVKLRWVENGEWKEKELTSEGGIYSFKMDQPYTIKVEFK